MNEWPIPPHFKVTTAMKALAAYRNGLDDAAAGHISEAFVWSDTVMGHEYWERVCENLQSAVPHREAHAMLVLQHWVNEAHGVNAPAEPAQPSPLTDDQVASWLALRGMVMIDKDELAALRRNGASGPPPIPADVYRRISRY